MTTNQLLTLGGMPSDIAFLLGQSNDLPPFELPKAKLHPAIEERPGCFRMGWVEYDEAESRLRVFAQAVRFFDWSGDPRMPELRQKLEEWNTGEPDQPVEGKTQDLWDLLLAVHRAERFCDGAIAESLITVTRIANEIRRRLLVPKKEDATQEELLRAPVLIPHRPEKDPREIKILDPACGSGHFLLHCFTLLLVIYEEAYDDPDLGTGLRADYPTKDALRKALPGLILRHNLHGIDIDLRAVQIAGLALWLRCQRAYQEMGLKKDRPPITKSNLVCAEPMPGEKELLDEFLKTLRDDHLEALIRQVMQVPEGTRVRATKAMAESLSDLVRTVWEKMRLAGEAGSLLKIEEELQDAIRKGQEEWEERLPLFRLTEYGLSVEPKERLVRFVPADVEGERITFWDRAEHLVRKALDDFVAFASNGGQFQRQLFVEDAKQGLGFVDVCRQEFDVVLMNPPFGVFPTGYKQQARIAHPNSYNDLLCAFTEHWYSKLTEGGRLAAITSRTVFFINSGISWRTNFLLSQGCLTALCDLGEGVMDEAMVESAAYILSRGLAESQTPFFRMLGLKDKDLALNSALLALQAGCAHRNTYVHNTATFTNITDAPFAYWVNSRLASQICGLRKFEPSAAKIRVGLTTLDNPRFVRALWEVEPSRLGVDGDFSSESQVDWAPLVIGGRSQPWFSPILVCVRWGNNGKALREYIQTRGSESRWIRSEEFYFRPGFSWTRRAVRFIPYAIPRGCVPTASRYMAYPNPGLEFSTIGVTASNIASAYLRFYGEWFCRPNFLVDNVKSLPWPKLSASVASKLEEKVRIEIDKRRNAYRNHEPFQDFVLPSYILCSSPSGALSDCPIRSVQAASR